MKPGQVSETVEVQANAVSLDTDSCCSLATRQPEAGGAAAAQRPQLPEPAVHWRGRRADYRRARARCGREKGNAISINGGRPTSNNYTLDGLVNTDTALNTPAVILSQDAIQEFKVQSETYSAEYGFSANQVNIVSKSGTNQLHGTAFEFLRNDAFDAKAALSVCHLRSCDKINSASSWAVRSTFRKCMTDATRPSCWSNYEGWRIRNGINQDTFNVPNPAWLSGDFSASGLTPVTARLHP